MNMSDNEGKWDKNNQWLSANNPPQEKRDSREFWGILILGLIGAVSTSCTFFRSQQSSWNNTNSGLFRSFREAAWERFKHRMQKQYEEEIERVERIRRMQRIFNKERDKYNNFNGSSRKNDYDPYNHQRFQQDEWCRGSHKKMSNSRETEGDSLSHHYSVLGLDRSRAKAYTEAEIKTAFRAKALKFHPDHNQNKIVAAETKFKEVVLSYNAIISHMKNMKL